MPGASHTVVIRFGRLGDTVLLQPLLHRLRQRYGQPCDLLVAGAGPAVLYAHQPDVAEVRAVLAPRRLLCLSGERWRAIGWLREHRTAPVYVCEPRPHALRRIDHMLHWAGMPPGQCTHLVDLPLRPGEHWVDHLLRFADVTPPDFEGRCRALAPETEVAPHWQADAAECADCADWLQARGLSGYPLVLLQPANKRTMRWNGVRAAADDDKAWPPQRWAMLARQILQHLPSARVLLCGCPGEAGYLRTICALAANSAVVSVADELPLARLKGLLCRAHSMVSVDTGPAHLAAALGCPLVVMFGGVSPAHWAPRAIPPGVVTVLGGSSPGGRVADLSVEQVLAAWDALPRQSVERPAAA